MGLCRRGKNAKRVQGTRTRLGTYLVFGPQQVEILAVDAVPDEMHPVVFDTEIQVSEPEDEPRGQSGVIRDFFKTGFYFS